VLNLIPPSCLPRDSTVSRGYFFARYPSLSCEHLSQTRLSTKWGNAFEPFPLERTAFERSDQALSRQHACLFFRHDRRTGTGNRIGRPIGAKFDVATDSSPSPCGPLWGGSGVGSGQVAPPPAPHPIPSRIRSEGIASVRPPLNLTPMRVTPKSSKRVAIGFARTDA